MRKDYAFNKFMRFYKTIFIFAIIATIKAQK